MDILLGRQEAGSDKLGNEGSTPLMPLAGSLRGW